MFTIQFKHCKVLAWPGQKCLVTIFEDGTELPAAPNDDDESRNTATRLGYGDDLWSMTFDHEVVHTMLAELDGLPVSPALWAAAHPDEIRDHAALNIEEDRVMELQRFVRYYLNYCGDNLPGL